MIKSLKNTVREIVQEFRHKTYFRQVLTSYIIVSCFTFLIFSVLLLSKIQEENNRTILGFAGENIGQARSFNESVLHDISDFAYRMLDEVHTYQLLYGDGYNINTSIAARDTYDRIQFSNSMITSVDFINFTTNSVLTRTNRMSLDDYYDTELLAYIEALEPGRRPVFYQPRESYYSGKHTKAERVLSLIFYTSRRGALVINLDYDAYASQINLARNSENMDLIILNNNNFVMAASNDEYFMLDFSNDPLYLEVMKQPSDEGRFTWNSDEGAQTVLYQKNTLMGMTYLSIVSPYREHSKSYLFGLTLRYSLVYILMTFFLSLVSSTILYRPVRHLKSSTLHVQKLLPGMEKRAKNDFDLIESVFQNLLQEYTALKQAHGSLEDQKEQKLLRLLLEQPYVSILPQNDDLLALENSFAYENYMVFVIDVTIPTNPDMEMDIPFMKFLIENVATELISETIAIRSIETVTPRVLFLANFTELDAVRKENLTAAIRQIQALFRQRGHFEIGVGFGCATDSLDTICTSYETAKTALDTGMLHAADSISFYDDMKLPGPDGQKYPFAIAGEITSAIKNTDADALDRNLNSFFDAIDGYEYNSIRRHLLHLNDSLQQFEHANSLDILSTLLSAENDLGGSTKLLSEYQEQFRNRCRYDLKALSEIKQHSRAKNELIEQVQSLIAENIYNANLSVIMLAEQVGLSVNYLRNVYKENTGESLSTYITNCKLEIIYHLLASTDTSIQEISDNLGFATKNYFFTFFKKHTGMTPNEYRNRHKA